ncbi:hypothetical protein GQF03_11305 [Sneathiella chungangensis]|uniref:Membrane transport protein MMPL domain-containing protein n=1 Tax=Sneathiella chungangensis TaxID=1418234 RepID=A0A845MHL8_9PROT|nr:hypothetical protein [Sneathiella chungangensis]MZR22920.1 hypothetical protein [Sneathiella chungangensis]
MSRVGLWVYVSLLCAAIAVIGWRLQDGLPLDTNIVAMLPQSDRAEWVARAEAAERTQGTDQLIALVGHADFETARAAALELGQALVDGGILKSAQSDTGLSTLKHLNEILFPHRTELLSEGDRRLLATGQEQVLIDRALVQILSPLSLADAELIRRDPFLLLPNYLSASTENRSKLLSRANVLAVEEKGKWYVLVRGKLVGNPFDKGFQTRTLQVFEDTARKLGKSHGDITILKTGAVFYGEHAYRQAENEAGFIGMISLIGIIVLNFFVFRSFQPLALSLLAIASGIAGGLAVTLLFFGTLQLLALVFGAGLIGISVDYAFHYFCERFKKENSVPAARARAIRSGLTLGLVSSVLGFITLALTPFPGLQQIALFSASGLTLAYLTVLYAFPYLDRAKPFTHGDKFLAFSMLLHHFWWRPEHRKWRYLLVSLLVLAGLFGATRIVVDDDVRRLQSLPQALQAEEQAIRLLAGIENQTHRFFVRGSNTEEVLQTEEALAIDLAALRASGKIGNYRMISQFVPSRVRQLENQKLIDETLMPKLDEQMAVIGLSGAPPYHRADGVLTLDQLSAAALPGLFSQLRIYTTPGIVVHAVTLSGVNDRTALSALAEKSENIALISQADSLSKTFGAYRLRALIMLAIAYCVVWVFLSLRYGIFGSIKVMMPSMSAVLLAPCLLALTGEPFTFFNAMSLMLIFAIGLDYALFNRESSGERQRRAMLANGLSTISTLLAFGLLSLSETFAIHAFGITILVGITLAYVLAPLASDLDHPMTEPL